MGCEVCQYSTHSLTRNERKIWVFAPSILGCGLAGRASGRAGGKGMGNGNGISRTRMKEERQTSCFLRCFLAGVRAVLREEVVIR